MKEYRMKKEKIHKLEASGWTVGDTGKFLSLSSEENDYIEMKMSLSKILQKTRVRKKMTQQDVAKLLRSSQSRVAKMETGDSSVSVDLLVRSLLALGTSRKMVGKIIATGE